MIAIMMLLIMLVCYVATSSMEDNQKTPFYIFVALVSIIYVLTVFL